MLYMKSFSFLLEKKCNVLSAEIQVESCMLYFTPVLGLLQQSAFYFVCCFISFSQYPL